MYDNIDFWLQSGVAGGVDFLSAAPKSIEITGQHDFNGVPVLSGKIDGLRVTVTPDSLRIKDGSLCKWFLGDNFQTMQRADTKQAIEKLSDILSLPMDQATVTRIDVAQNFIVKHPPLVYFNHLGEYAKSRRLEQPDGLYYSNNNGLLVFYNKTKEQQDKNQPIPELYQGRNTLRYEQRYKRRLGKTFGVDRVTAACLYDEAFYKGIIDRWRDAYQSIKKVNDIQLRFEGMKTKKDLYRYGVLSLVTMSGGERAMLSQITEAQRMGELSSKQAFDLRAAIAEACKTKDGLTVQSDVITELDQKVKDAARFYR